MRSTNFVLFLTLALCIQTLTYAQSEGLFSGGGNDSAPEGPPPEILTASSGIRFVRTPESAFAETIEAFPAPPQYITLSNGLRMAYTDSGFPSKGTFLLVHGEPDWGYLYRRMVPILSAGGYRVVVPDLVGFGRSDKPINASFYTYPAHTDAVAELIEQLQLTGLIAFLQDWGGPIGLTIGAENPEIFSKFVLANTFLPNGTDIAGVSQFRDFIDATPVFDSGAIIQSLTTTNLSSEILAAYNTAFPSEIFKAGARSFPFIAALSPDAPDLERSLQAREALRDWTKPVLLQWGLADPVLGEHHRDFRALIPGTDGQPHQFFPEGSHFIQEDAGVFLADGMLRWLKELEMKEQAPEPTLGQAPPQTEEQLPEPTLEQAPEQTEEMVI